MQSKKQATITSWREQCKLSVQEFCSQYYLGVDTFNKWLENETTYPTAYHALRRFLKQVPDHDFQTHVTSINKTPITLLSHLTEIVQSELKTILFVDCDNQHKHLHLLHELNKDKKDLLFLLFFTKGSFSESMIGLEDHTNVLMLQTAKNEKDAADVLLTMCATLLHMRLEQNKNVKFNFISDDKFVIELQSQMQLLGRNSSHTAALDKMDHIIKGIHKASTDDVNLKDLDPQKPPPTTDYLTVYQQLTDDELRQIFKVNWKSSQAAFCDIHNIDKSNFSKWLRGLRTSPASAKAVAKYYVEITTREV